MQDVNIKICAFHNKKNRKLSGMSLRDTKRILLKNPEIFS